MDAKQVKIEGKVERQVVSRASKSEHRAIVLKTKAGEVFVLRRKGGPAFADPDLVPLVGRAIAAEGIAAGGTLIMNSWKSKD